MKFALFGTTWLISIYPMWEFSVHDFEYWRRYCIGFVYILKWHPWEQDDYSE